jgi:hypothetical protein
MMRAAAMTAKPINIARLRNKPFLRAITTPMIKATARINDMKAPTAAESMCTPIAVALRYMLPALV